MDGILVKDITKRYGDKTVLIIFPFISTAENLRSDRSERAGKTTLIKIMIGLVKQDRGGFDRRNGIRQKCHCDQGKIRRCTAGDRAIGYGVRTKQSGVFARLYGLTGKTLKQKVDEVLELTGLTEHQKKRSKPIPAV